MGAGFGTGPDPPWLTRIMAGAKTRGMCPGEVVPVGRLHIDLLRVRTAICRAA
jgi:hypothetical protein